MDSLTARYLARELDARWRGRRVDGWILDREARVVTFAAEGLAVRFDLAHPDVRVFAAEPLAPQPALRGWTVRAVSAPEDDRRLFIELGRPGRFKGSTERRATLEVSALPAARGAVLRDAGGARLGSVGSRLPPAIAPRPVLGDGEILSASRAGDADRLSTGRWMSPLVARWLCDEPETSVERYHLICSDAPARPSRCGDRVVPFPFCAGAVPVDSLVEPREEAVALPVDDGPQRRARARARLQAELDNAANAPVLRRLADVLVALGDGPPPAMVMLSDGSAVVPALPGETSAVVAARLYAEARSKERALKAVPKRLAALDSAAAAPLGARSTAPAGQARRAAVARLPYRTYRSSGGLDIWVGRGAASNDELTFHVASPDDVWLHARDDAGAHVVLRWTKPDIPPPRDLVEAALLAAWHSRSRGSAVVPVDWTRRKHVRKPRGAKPGSVTVANARTLMVRPSGEVERRLRTQA